MLTRLFDWITDTSVKYKWVTIGLTVAVLVAGVLSLNGLNLELVPRVEFPQTVVIVQWPDSESAQMFLDEITLPTEEMLNSIDGVVNVETTTNPTFAAIIVRYDFGENGDRILEEIESGLENIGLPDEASTQVLNFSLSDLPVIVASASSSTLTLPELKAIIEEELQPAATNIEDVSEVATSGGQELPEQALPEEAVSETPEEVAIEDPTPTPEPEDPGKLPAIVVTGARQLGLEIEYAQEVTVDVLRGLEGTNEQILAVLRLVPADTWRYAPPETISYLPTEITDNFEPELVAELNEIAAEFGGVEQYTVEEAFAAINADPAEETDEIVVTDPITPTATMTPTEQTIMLLAPVVLPAEWIAGAQAVGQTISTTADLTPELMGGIAQVAPEQFALLTPEMWRAIDPNVTAVVLPVISPTLPITLVQQLVAIQNAATGTPPTPVDLPPSWIAAAGQAGLTISTTADIPAEAVGQLAAFAPQLLDDLTPEMLFAFPPAVLRALPPDYVAGLPIDQQEAIMAVLFFDNQDMTPPVAQLPTVAPVPLPAEWIAGAQTVGQTISTTADLTPELMGGIAQVAPEQFALLTPEMWRAIDPNVTAVVLPVLSPTLPITLVQQLVAIQNAATGTPPTPVDLPPSWIAAAGQAGLTISTTADIPAEAVGQLAAFAPQLLDDLTPDILLAFSPAVLAQLPTDYMTTLDGGTQQTVVNIIIWDVRQQGGETVAETDENRLPDIIIQGANHFGMVLEYPEDIDPDTMRIFAGLGEQSAQLLGLLSPVHLRALPAESIALLPPPFVETLDAELRAELDALASEFGGAGALAIAEAENADPAALPLALVEGAAQAGFEIETADQLAPDFIRLLGGLGEQASAIFGFLTPDNLRLMPAESIALLPAPFLETLDPELRAELDELASEFGGAGQLAIQEAEEAAALAEGSPPLSGIWLEPNPQGEPSQFQTAADLINNPFAPTAGDLLNAFPGSPNVENPADWMGELNVDVIRFIAENEPTFAETLTPIILELLPSDSILYLLDNYPEAFDAELTERLLGVASGDIEVFVPESSITRTDGDPSVVIQIFKGGDANTVVVAERVFEFFDEFREEHPDITITVAFEQATFIEESIEGVSREGVLGAGFAVLIILLFLSGHVNGRYRLSLRATVVTAISIPLSVFTAILFMRWIPSTLGAWAESVTQSTDNGFLSFVLQIFPSNLTLNIMTLSGLTVAIGRVVDDSIVVLENSYRYIQKGVDPREAVMKGTREVAVAIFSATVTTMGVFLPLGLIGGVIGSFFLPFGLTVTYALAASFIVSITVVPALTYLLIRKEHIPEDKETAMQRYYTPILVWSLKNRAMTMIISTVIFIGSLFLLAQLPQSFIPGLGDPTINTVVRLPAGTQMVATNELVEAFEIAIQDIDGIETIQTEIGGAGGFEAFFGGGVSQNLANVVASVTDQEAINEITNEVRQEAQTIFGEENVQVSAASQSGFSGFAVIVTGDNLDDLRSIVPDVIDALESVDMEGDGRQDIANVGSNADDAGGDAEVILRIDGRPAISFSGELETTNTIGVTDAAKQAIVDLGLPEGIEVTEGFDSQQQTQGFQDMVGAIAWSILIVYVIMAITFRSLVHPFTILFSLPFALVGASAALYLTNSVLGISAMIGLLMLVGVVVTNGIVLMELVQQLKEQGQSTYDALVEAGRTRLRPIWMTALTAILALIPLAASNEAGAIIASELARAVMGGLIVSTALTLVVVPVVYSLFDELIQRVRGRKA